MKSIKPSLSRLLLFAITLFASACGMANANGGGTPGGDVVSGPVGVHFKIDGKQYDIPLVRGLYDKQSATLAIYNAGLPGFPETIITLAIGSNFTGSTGTFKSDANGKGFVFGFTLGNMKDMIGYAGGKDDPDRAFTVASTPISITITSFSISGSDMIKGNISAQGTFSGTAYDFKNKRTVQLTDGTFSVHP